MQADVLTTRWRAVLVSLSGLMSPSRAKYRDDIPWEKALEKTEKTKYKFSLYFREGSVGRILNSQRSGDRGKSQTAKVFS